MNEIKFIYEDDDILVCHKPAGIATEGARSYSMDVVSAARNYLNRKNRAAANGKKVYVATVHRLDQPVEGVIILAKNKKAATELSDQIKKRTTDKYYYALCFGNIESDSGTLENLIVKKEDGFADIVTEEESKTYADNCITKENGEKIRIIAGEIKNAKLEYEVVERSDNKTLLRIKLLTGRFHQIRAQLSYIGYPILGDQKYGTEESISFSKENGIRNVCLVSFKFALNHPSKIKRMTFEIEPDNPQIKELLSKH